MLRAVIMVNRPGGAGHRGTPAARVLERPSGVGPRVAQRVFHSFRVEIHIKEGFFSSIFQYVVDS